MKYRKIVPQGKGAYTITLPKNWVEKNNILDYITIYENNNNLIIQNPNKPTNNQKSITINLGKSSIQGYRSVLGALYRQGYDEILIEKNSSIIINSLEIAVNSILGFELFFEKNHIIVKNIFSGEKTTIKSHIQRMIFSIKQIQQLLQEKNSFNEIQRLRDSILKQRDLVLRLVKKESNNQDEIFPYYIIALSLWGVTRGYYYLGKQLLEINDPLFDKINNYFSKTFEQKLSFKDIEKKHIEYRNITKELHENISKKAIATYGIIIMQEIQLADSNLALLYSI